MNFKSILILLFMGICFKSFSENVASESASVPVRVRAEVVKPVTVAKYTVKNTPQGKKVFLESDNGKNKKKQTFIAGKNMKKINGIYQIDIEI
ncbi:MAG: hypothetical protein ACRCZH_08580 [Cetobacterium sp.]